MPYKLLLTGGIVALIVVGSIVFFTNTDKAQSPTPQTTQQDQEVNQPSISNTDAVSTQTETNSTENEQIYSAEEVSRHATKDDCWTIINNSVYDLTSYIARHPGRDNILSACGIDSTSYFNGEQAGQLGGIEDHSSSNRALRDLEALKIGQLTQ